MSFSDPDLVARVLLRDDRNAFAELVRRHQSTVRMLHRRLTGGDAALADDLAQETFLRVYRGLAQWRGDSKLSSWIYRVAYNVFASEHEKRARRATDPTAEVPVGATDEIGQDTAMLRRDLEAALLTLPVPQRSAIVLTAVHGVSNEEAALILDCPVGTVKTHIHRGKQRLREVLQHAAL
jgi:RNA polymerase sigma factor (sigma-70 family)